MSDPIEKGHCPDCVKTQRAFVRGKHSTSWEAPDVGVSGWTNYLIMECCGCERVFFKTEDYFSEDVDVIFNPKTGEHEHVYLAKESHWPNPITRKEPEWLDKIRADHPELVRMLKEVYAALNSNLPVLAAAGMRTAFEQATVLLGVDPNLPFIKKTTELQTKGLIGLTEREGLETLVDGGNAAAHRAWRPSDKQLMTMIDRLESFLYGVLVLHPEVIELKKQIPAKPAKAALPPPTSGPVI